jgi:hypothetical protein
VRAGGIVRRGIGLALTLALVGAAHAARAAEPAEPVALALGPSGIAVAGGEIDSLDVDRYVVSLAAGELLFVALFDPADGELLDTRIAVSRGGAVVASNDDGGPNLLSRLALQASAAGSYEIAITGFRDTGFTGAHPEGEGGAKPYTLVVGVAPPLTGETEPNDAAPSPLGSAGAIVRGTLGPLDVDRFSIPLSSGAKLAVSLFPLDGSGVPLPSAELGDPRLAFFAGSSLVPFAQNDDGGPGLFANLARTAPASPVEIAVTGFRDLTFAGVHAEGPFDYALVAAPLLAAASRCDVVPVAGVIDTLDVNAIFAARNTPASGPDDPRDADGDGTITVLDASQCRLQCTNPQCASTAPRPACGLLGIEPLAVYGALVLLRRRQTRRHPEVSS